MDDCSDFNPALRSDWLSRCYAAGQLCAAKALRVSGQAGCLLLHHRQRASLCRLRGTPESCGAHAGLSINPLFRTLCLASTTDVTRATRQPDPNTLIQVRHFHFRHFQTTFSVTESTGRCLISVETPFSFTEQSKSNTKIQHLVLKSVFSRSQLASAAN